VVIALLAASFDVLGENYEEDTGTWCWIRGDINKQKRLLWMLFTGNGWEILTYVLTAVLYILLMFFMYRKVRIFILLHTETCTSRYSNPTTIGNTIV